MTAPDHFSALRLSASRTKHLVYGLAAVLISIYLASGIYSIQPSEAGVLFRFGRIAASKVTPGIHYAFPWPVHRIVRVPIQTVMRLSIDDFFEQGEIGRLFKSYSGLEPLLITGDNNLLTLECILQYSIYDPAAYLTSLKDSELTLRNLACDTIINATAVRSIDDILIKAKTDFQQRLQQIMQQRLDELNSGLNITFVEVREVRPPSRVQAAFNDVVNAMIDKEKTINTAYTYQNEIIPKAKGDAARTLEQARAYKQETVSMAGGDTDRFLARLEEYRRHPDLTRRRLQLEMLQARLPVIKRHCIVGETRRGSLARIITPP